MKPKNLVIVRAVREQGLTHAEAAARYGVSRQWVHALVRRYDTEGPEGVTPRSRAPKTRPGTTPKRIRDRIVALRLELTAQGADAGPVTIVWHLHNEGYPAPSTATIRRILHTQGLITPAPAKRPRNSYIRFQADLPNECWQADITHWNLASGIRVEILNFLDDHSRLLLSIHAQAAFTGPMVVTAMTNLKTNTGHPTQPSPTTAWSSPPAWHATKVPAAALRNSSLPTASRRRTAAPDTRKPRAKSNASTKPQTQAGSPTPPRHHRRPQHPAGDFQTWYNTARPHRSTGRRTPQQAYTALPKATPTGQHRSEWRSRTDKVDKNGKLTLRYAGQLRHLGIGRAHAGKPVLMLIHDRDISVSDANTGEIIAEHTIDPTRDYQPRKHHPASTMTRLTDHPSPSSP